MPLNDQQDAAASAGDGGGDGSVEYVFLSTPNLIARNRVLLQLHVVGIPCDESPIGIRIACRDLDWRLLLEAIAADLSEDERAETRVAVLRQSADPQALHRTVFRAHGLNTFIDDLQNQWFDEILKRDGIDIHLQPLVQFPPGRVHGYECLMRGIDADGAVVCPTRMFDLARKLSRVEELDERCRNAAIRSISRVRGAGLTFFINFIPGATRNPRKALAAMTEQLDDVGLKPGQIALEVVETEKVDDRRELMHLLRSYRKAGFKLALDDVGAGYSSLLSVSKVRPDYIKLDGELVRRAAGGALEAKIVRDLAETARQNGIVTIAEGIETPEQFRLAIDSGIRITQGYWLGAPRVKPLTQTELREVVARIRGAGGSDDGASVRPLRSVA
jgi:EAL domain-containing protein (putative c-di-GMP-specific phosphodiesterase class I)